MLSKNSRSEKLQTTQHTHGSNLIARLSSIQKQAPKTVDVDNIQYLETFKRKEIQLTLSGIKETVKMGFFLRFLLALDSSKLKIDASKQTTREFAAFPTTSIGGPIQCVVSYRDQCAHKHTNISLY